MKEQFLDYEHSKMMKELGLNEVCFGWFTDRADDKTQLQQMIFELSAYYDEGDIKNSEVDKEVYCAPLYQQAKEWLWEKHKISFMLFHFNETYNCEVSIEDAVLVEDENYFDSPITAEKEGINKAIEYLHSQLK